MPVYRKSAHCVFVCDYHIVLPTKYRRNILNEGVLAYIKLKLKEINKYHPDIVFKEVNHDHDHIHLLVSIPPQRSVGSVVRIVKANTARELKAKFPFLKKTYWGTESIWSSGYFVSTVGINEDIIKQYIENQGKEDAGQAKLELKWYPVRKLGEVHS